MVSKQLLASNSFLGLRQSTHDLQKTLSQQEQKQTDDCEPVLTHN